MWKILVKRKIWVGILLGVIILVSAPFFYLRLMLRPLVLRDNILIEEILNVNKTSPHITYGEFFEKAKKNIEMREDIIRSVRILKPYFYKRKLDLYVEFLHLENESKITSGIIQSRRIFQIILLEKY